MIDRCFRIWDADNRVWCHVPVCAAAAYNGPNNCLCDYRPSPRAADQIDAQRREIAKLRADLEVCATERARLWNENVRMRGKKTE